MNRWCEYGSRLLMSRSLLRWLNYSWLWRYSALRHGLSLDDSWWRSRLFTRSTSYRWSRLSWPTRSHRQRSGGRKAAVLRNCQWSRIRHICLFVQNSGLIQNKIVLLRDISRVDHNLWCRLGWRFNDILIQGRNFRGIYGNLKRKWRLRNRLIHQYHLRRRSWLDARIAHPR